MRTSLFWYTKDLRVDDLPALSSACESNERVVPVYVWDAEHLADEADNRKAFLLDSLAALDRELRARSSGLVLRQAETNQGLIDLCREHDASCVWYSSSRDPATSGLQRSVQTALRAAGIESNSRENNFLLRPEEIRTQSGTPFRVFTPFKNNALRKLNASVRSDTNASLAMPAVQLELPRVNLSQESRLRQKGGALAAKELWSEFRGNGLCYYASSRNELSNDSGTSKLSAHLNFGTISIHNMLRELMEITDPDFAAGKSAFINELLWREFNSYIAFHFPDILHRAFREEFTVINWPGRFDHLELWKEGRTGYPVVDAAMRQLRETGWMHNRARMIVASFLVKDLLIDWQEGEAHLMEWLTDGDQVQNNAGWQWSASTGVDAQPYFRIFNPITQGKKFDPSGGYIRQYIPELRNRPDDLIHQINVEDDRGYPAAIVDHASQRERSLEMFKAAMTNFRK